MGIIDVESWNAGAYCGLIFKVLIEPDSKWARWIREYKLKRKHFWIMEVSSDSSWTLKGLFKHRKIARQIIKYVIADGENTYLWHDIWYDS